MLHALRIAGILLCGALLTAQPCPGGPQSRENRPQQGREERQQKEKARRTQAIQKYLQIGETKAEEIAQSWMEQDARVQEPNHRIGELLFQMERILEDGSPEPDKAARLRPLVQDSMDSFRRHIELRILFRKNLPNLVKSPAQRAAFIVLFERWFGGGPPSTPGAPPDIRSHIDRLKGLLAVHISRRLRLPDQKAQAIAEQWADLELPRRNAASAWVTTLEELQRIVEEPMPNREKSRRLKPLLELYTTRFTQALESRRHRDAELLKTVQSPAQQARLLRLLYYFERAESSFQRSRPRKNELE